MPLGSLIGAGFVSISADTKPAEKAIKGLAGVGSLAMSTMLSASVAPLVAGIGGIAVGFAAAGVAAGAFGAAVKPQFTAITSAAKQYAAVTDAQTKAELASSQARGLATKSGVAYESALAKASAEHQRAQQLAISGSKGAKQAQKEAAQATLDAQRLATKGGKEYAAALANQKSAQDKAKQAAAEYKQTLAGMPPATAATAVAYSHLTDAVTKWSDSLAPKTMPIFTSVIEKIQRMLPKLTPIVSKASDVISMFLLDLDAGTAGTVFDTFGKHMSDLSGGALKNFLETAKNLAVGFVGILNAFTPMSSGVTGGLTSLTKKFADWGASLAGSDGITNFFATAKKEGPLIGKALEQIATAGFHIAQGIGPLSGIGLKVAEALARILSALPTPVLNQVLNLIVAINLVMKAYAIYTALAAAATWLFGTATGASRVSMALLYAQLAPAWIAMKAQALWTGITTAATWLWNTSVVSSTVSVISSGAAYLARNAVMLASATATTVVTAATWLWTAAMGPAIASIWAMTVALLSNPITWVVIAIVALIAVIVLIAMKTTWFETAWKYTWGAIVTVASWAWSVIGPTVMSLWSALKTLGEGFMWLWSKAVAPALRFIVAGFLDMVGTVLHAAADMFGWVPGLGDKLKSAVRAFDSFRDGVNAALSGVQSKTVSVNVQFHGSGAGQQKKITAATGGPITGPGTGTSDSIPAMLSNNEHVWTAAEVSAAGGHQAVAGIRRSVLSGKRFASGGPVGLGLSVNLPSTRGIAASVDGAVSSIMSAGVASMTAQSFDVGGWLMPGRTLAVNNTGRPERVGGGDTYILNATFSGPVGSQAELQNWQVEMLTTLKQRGRLRGLVGP